MFSLGFKSEYDPNLKMHSLDEAFLDLAPYLAIRMTKHWTHDQIRNELSKQNMCSPTQDESGVEQSWSESMTLLASLSPQLCLQHASDVIAEMREQVYRATGLTCSAGLAPNFLLAKVASDQNKPNGQCIVDSDHDRILQFLHPMPTRKVCGIGRVTEKTLQAFGITTVEHLYKERALVRLLFTPTSAGFLLRASVGCSSDHKECGGENGNLHGQKGISRERTFRPGDSWTEINSRLEDIANLLSRDMVKKNIWARTITVKVKLHTFDVYSRARSMPQSVFLQGAADLVAHATGILREIRDELTKTKTAFSVRLLGIRCSSFRGEEDLGQINIDKFLEPKQTTPTSPSSTTSGTDLSKPRRTKQLDCDKFKTSHDMTLDTNDPKMNIDNRSSSICVRCPLCQQSFPLNKNSELNQHIDSCLSGRVVRDVIREQYLDTSHSKGFRRKRRITDFY